jgi:ribosome recycling factor
MRRHHQNLSRRLAVLLSRTSEKRGGSVGEVVSSSSSSSSRSGIHFLPNRGGEGAEEEEEGNASGGARRGTRTVESGSSSSSSSSFAFSGGAARGSDVFRGRWFSSPPFSVVASVSSSSPPPLAFNASFARCKHGKNKKNKNKGGKKGSDSSSSSSDGSGDEEEEEDETSDDDDEEGADVTLFTLASVERETAKAVENLKLELGKLRTSRASTGVVENIMIDNIYDSSGPPMPLKSLGAITVRDAKTISIALYDNSEPNKNAVENAIVNEKHLKFGAKKDESGVIVTLPEMDSNARKEVVKMAQELGERSKISVRRARKKAIDTVKKQTTSLKLFGEDEKKRFEKSIQKVHDDAIKEIDRLEKQKKEQIESGV